MEDVEDVVDVAALEGGQAHWREGWGWNWLFDSPFVVDLAARPGLRALTWFTAFSLVTLPI